MIRVNKRGQMAIFVIVALVLVLGIVLFFIFRGGFGVSSIPQELKPVYDTYSSCIETQTKIALDVAGTQGGRVDTGVYVPGSEYAPYGNKMNFLGFGVPYWFTVTGNGIAKENVPSGVEVQDEIAGFVEEHMGDCDFTKYYEQGFEIEIGKPDVKVAIAETAVKVSVDANVKVTNGEQSAVKMVHEVTLQSKFGKFLTMAQEIYDKERQERFLEVYTEDVLRLYTPVDGTEISCSPKVWKTREVFDELQNGLEANIASLKFVGGDYELKNKEAEYFVIDKSVDENVNLLYSKSWPTKIQVYGEGVDSELMIAESVGTQAGMGVMGFCYVPYHFVYDLGFPVMVQIYNNEELFQFPIVVLLNGNVAQPIQSTEELGYLNQNEFDLCEFPNQDIEVRLYDVNLNRVDGDISYSCFDQKCRIGETKNGELVGKVPGCVNGQIVVRAEGYADKVEIFSSNEETSADIILDKEYEVDVGLDVSGKEVYGNAFVTFSKDNGEGATAVLPQTTKVKLTEGQYTVRAYVYSNSSIKIPASTKTQCADVPRQGILGWFGGTKEQCFDVTIPETEVGSALIGGGETEDYFLAGQLESGRIQIHADGFNVPKTLEELQYNFASFDSAGLEVDLG